MLITNPSDLAAYFDHRVSNVPLNAGGRDKIAQGNSSRVYIGFSTSAAAMELFISPLPSVSQGFGYFVGASNQPLEIWYSKHGALVCAEWFANTSFAGGAVCVIEVIYRPRILEPRQWSSGRQKESLLHGRLRQHYSWQATHSDGDSS